MRRRHGSREVPGRARPLTCAERQECAPLKINLKGNSDSAWAEYYRLRNRARISVISLPVALILLVLDPASLMTRVRDFLSGLSPSFQIGVVFGLIGCATILIAAPLLKWSEWRCPRCAHRFALPPPLGQFTIVPLLARLVVDWGCASCGSNPVNLSLLGQRRRDGKKHSFVASPK